MSVRLSGYQLAIVILTMVINKKSKERVGHISRCNDAFGSLLHFMDDGFRYCKGKGIRFPSCYGHSPRQ